MVNRAELVKKLDLTSRALGDAAAVFKCFVFNGESVTCYNDTLAIVAPCEIGLTFAVNGPTLLGLLKNSQSEEVEFELEQFDVLIKAGKSTFKLPFLTKDSFLFEEPDETTEIELFLNNELKSGIQSCLETASNDLSQQALMGLVIPASAKKVTFYSCDGDALTRYSTQLKNAVSSDKTIPGSFCDAVLKSMKDSDSASGILSICKDWVIAALDSEYIIYGRLLNTKSPVDHADLVKKTLKKDPVFVYPPKELKEALGRAAVISDQETVKTILSVKNGVLSFLTEASIGIVRDEIPLKNHSDVQAHVSASAMLNLLLPELAIMDNCCVFREGDNLFRLLSNMD